MATGDFKCPICGGYNCIYHSHAIHTGKLDTFKPFNVFPKPLASISKRHQEWLQEMDFCNKATTIELLMFIVSECGEAANEVRGEAPTENFKLELADIILRVLGVAERHNIDMDAAIEEKLKLNREKGKKEGRIK